MKKTKINFGNILIVIFLLVLFLIQVPQIVFAGTLTVLKDRLNRQKENLTTGVIHTVVFTTQNAVLGGVGNNKVILTFPDADDGKWCATAGNDVIYTACTEDGSNQLPGLPTARCTQGGVGTYDTIFVESVDNLTALTKYCLQVSDGPIAKLGTPAATTTGVITVKTNNGAVDIDNGKLPVDIVINDQVVVTADVPGAPPPPPPGGGGGGGEPIGQATVIFEGKAYPAAVITILRNKTVIGTATADSSGNFSKTLIGMAGGTWTFGFFAYDSEGRRSVTLSFTISIVDKLINKISGIFISPTIALSEEVVRRGATMEILGQSYPKSEIQVFVSSSTPEIKKTTSSEKGKWKLALDTTPFIVGTHTTKAKAIISEGEQSYFSDELIFKIAEFCKGADLNFDNKIDLIDFSILLYYWGQKKPANICTDINQDGTVDLIDFSIMMYYWTK